MSNPLPLGKKTLSVGGQKRLEKAIISQKMLILALILMFSGSVAVPGRVLADTDSESALTVKSPLFEQKSELFAAKQVQEAGQMADNVVGQNDHENKKENASNEPFSDKIYALVGDTPIKEMVPFISERNEKVAAFLVGIAKKESSLGIASPSKDGKTCYNYWGYKGEGGRGVGMGYACFASAQEAVSTVGDKIEDLVNKDRTTPAKMVDTWKCGSSCVNDPGAPGWVAAVAVYFNALTQQNG